MEQNLPISDYALIGNGQTAALVSRNGSVDWCCWPRFDSPALFCRLLDVERGGFFRIAPAGDHQTQRQYLGRTNVLQTFFTTQSGVVRLTDLMPAPSERGENRVFPHRILRRVECLKGRVDVEFAFRPTFDYAREPARIELHGDGAIAYGQEEALSLVTGAATQQHGDTLAGRKTFSAGESGWWILTHCSPSAAEELMRFDVADAEAELERTVEYWEHWSGQCQYVGPYRQQVLRSALVLKLLVFEPTGGLTAAPTTSLPDEVGGERNWDYRYCWLRDSALVLDALQRLGYHDESKRFIGWLEDLCLRCEDDLRIVYCVDGSPAPDERTLEHLAGYRGSRPVRVGNGATRQRQVDVYGHTLDAVVLCFERMPRELGTELWDFLRSLADRAAAEWKNRDHGPWEMRGPAQFYLYSQLYCWVGLDRAIRFAEQRQLSGNVQHWRKQREAIRETILSQGYSSGAGAFTQTFGTERLDAAALAIPLTGFLPIEDARVQSTVERIQEHLTKNGLVYRYRIDDGLPGSDATFTLCSYWLVMNLALSGRKTEASELFEQICGHANDVGLLSEQIDPDSGDLLGNFPQGFAHLGLIRAALHLEGAT